MKEALSYDVRIIPKPDPQPPLDSHESLLRSVCAEIVGSDLADLQWERMQLLGPLSGMGLTLPSVSADAAFV